MAHLTHLRALEAAGLIRLAASQPDLEYTFRHALQQEAVYHTLSKFARASTHRAVAEALEAVYANGGAAHAAHLSDLAFHYAEAGQWDKALDYARRAGEHEQAMYAPREALAHFDQAVGAARRLGVPVPWPVLRARGQVYETLGQPALARVDYELALAQARAAGDRPAEWQSLLDLGFFWSASDYVQAGQCFRAALELARQMDEPACLGHSLNRLGNWHVNNEEPDIGHRYHQEALALFEALGDRQSVAQTLDLLGITAMLAGDVNEGSRYYPGAIALFRELGDLRGLINSQSIYLLRALTYETQLQPTFDLSLSELRQEVADILALAGSIGWRAAEAFIYHILCIGLGPRGVFDEALEAGHRALRIAEEIEHLQWRVSAHYSLGALYLDLLAWPLAQEHLEAALALAQQSNSRVWVRLTSSCLAQTLLAQHAAETPAGPPAAWHAQPPAQWPPRLARVLEVLNQAHNNRSTTPLTIGESFVGFARAHLALACGEPARALEISEQLQAYSAKFVQPSPVLPAVWLLQAEALAGLNRQAEAVAHLEAARDRAREQATPTLLWRSLGALTRLYAAQGQTQAADAAHTEAEAILTALAQKLPAGSLRENFLREARQKL